MAQPAIVHASGGEGYPIRISMLACRVGLQTKTMMKLLLNGPTFPTTDTGFILFKSCCSRSVLKQSSVGKIFQRDSRNHNLVMRPMCRHRSDRTGISDAIARLTRKPCDWIRGMSEVIRDGGDPRL